MGTRTRVVTIVACRLERQVCKVHMYMGPSGVQGFVEGALYKVLRALRFLGILGLFWSLRFLGLWCLGILCQLVCLLYVQESSETLCQLDLSGGLSGRCV